MSEELSSERNAPLVVAMSGGVDSSVAAMLLHDQGHELVGVSMQVWDYRNHGGCSSRATCCAPDDFTDARMVASRIGIPYYVFDFESSFRAEVIDRFVDTYRRGETPNPCVDCNNRVKFRELRERAESFGACGVATGHYAKIERKGDRLALFRGRDKKKDQSYFLYGLRQTELASTHFPLGDMTKEEVRERARAGGLVTAEKPESQDICFVSGSVKDFLVKIGGGTPKGEIVDTAGKKLGEHDGIHSFTVGQRRGINVGGCDEPLYVLELDPENNRVIVGKARELEQDGFAVKEANWVSPEAEAALSSGDELSCIAQLRHRHSGVRTTVSAGSKGVLSVRFAGEPSPVSPGQAAVFYSLDNQEVLGGGRIVHEPRFAARILAAQSAA